MEIGDWYPIRVIGRGSTASVSLATATGSGDHFAVKSTELSRSGILQREQRILSGIDSPYVVAYLGFDIAPQHSLGYGLYYNLFMEYASGGSLGSEIKRHGGRLDELDIRRYASDMLCGLDYLHSKGIVHCDVKSQNILIGSDRRAKIGDLGCARWAAAEGDGLRGTPMFMAPEVARGEEQGIPADIWALGCTVIEMATGSPPWPHVSEPIGVLHRIAFSDDVPDFPSSISDEGKDFLSKCLRRDSKQRWTAKQLLGHPFVAESLSSKTTSANDNWVSPRSTLDLFFWEAQSEDEEEGEVDKLPEDDPFLRIQQLIGGGDYDLHDSNWTWDESWMAVRNYKQELSSSCEDSLSVENGGLENSPAGSSSDSTGGISSGDVVIDNSGTFRTEQLMFTANLTGIAHNLEGSGGGGSSSRINVGAFDVKSEEGSDQLFDSETEVNSCNCFTKIKFMNFRSINAVSSLNLIVCSSPMKVFFYLPSIIYGTVQGLKSSIMLIYKDKLSNTNLKFLERKIK